jgi:hypothetical protein
MSTLNTIEPDGTNEGRPASLGEKIAWALIAGMVTWLFYNQ